MIKLNQIITLSVLSSSLLLGASPIPNSSSIEREIQAPKDIPIKQKDIVKIEGVQQDSLKDIADSKTILIKGFKIEGNTIISTNEILNSIKEFENRDLTFTQIQTLSSIISKLYQDKGYFVARAYLPAQNIEQNKNILNISILEGNYGEFKVINNSLVRNSVVQDIFDNTKFSSVIDTKVIERALLLINDRAGVKVSKAEISPGADVGTSNFNIETTATPRVDGYVVADNYGSRYTGLYRTQSLVNINSIATLGDKLSVSGLVSNGADLKNGRFAYELPLNSYGLKADVAYTRTNYNLVKEYKDLDAKGNANIYEAGLSYPLQRSTNQSFWLKGKYYHKEFKDYILDTKYEDKTINSFVASLDFEKYYTIGEFPSRVFANLNFTTGNLSSKYNNLNSGNYNKVDTYISNEIAFSEIFSLNTNLIAQRVLGNKKLDGSEDLSLGGAYGVKVYPSNEQSAENGYMINVELFSKLPSISFYNHKIGTFYDIGNVYQEKNQDVTFQRRTLQDVGFGYYANYKDFFAKVQVAWTLNSDPISSEKTSHQNSKILFQTGLVF
ncbi:ShlB/FhaC/HecB family hemolysin secretion/activation protein [Aliarcobacter lanthieri]|uniref:ShlB/FhaC/HecB family hemolysin secretion/activation protein n=1 Tax=Aliarcobacter lanthieri TaxID=1355374 RepID=UPI00047C7FD0|nr:ShlB/FhaC/HecB family hemolysin secretion/activation protein [Aliarcobacter lanthieri]QKF59495.1 hemolysin secretion/activation protein, ShlB/FhaC/HecB family [Aliarcobacter lanthieri]